MRNKIKLTGILITIIGISICLMCIISTSGMLPKDNIQIYKIGIVMGSGITVSILGTILTLLSDKFK